METATLLALLGTLGWTEILVIGGVLVLLFGAKRLPELARGMGRSMNEFQHGLREEPKDPPAEAAPPGPKA